ncbi:DUF418 domain-containing protein [Hydrogenophaga sp. BPS33]|uniref:DUF418 domain-containing protein n=1 Tax=Hydrogenophaga sp. BPS33 TaxID=2651974 RepID=UPI00131FFF88|nr:DUF418 domain-containing protein [Hydrogenophaga sp. BPS33]QHE86069.1 DUF418 domain-containing protein [Hydrogenophaga sp. BPS33]
MQQPSRREALPDVLRALALVSVLVVNAVGYAVAPYGSPLGLRTPPDSTWAALTQGLVAAVLQGKGYTLLAFVFGMSLWLAARGRSRPDALRRGQVRNQRLLGLGVVHGVFIYFGDILTMYALVGRTLLARLHMPWSRLRRHFRRALVWAVLAKAGLLTLMFVWLPERTDIADGSSLSTVQGAWSFLKLNASNYLANQVVALVFLGPVLYLCMLAGVAAARLRLLTHPRWRAALRRFLRRFGLPVLALTAVYGCGVAWTAPTAVLNPWLEALGDVSAIPVAAVYVAALALASSGGQARWCHGLVPLGRRTLSLYVGHSALCLALFSGVGLAWLPTTAQTVLLSLGLWGLAWAVARRSGDRRWPLEAWMARR